MQQLCASRIRRHLIQQSTFLIKPFYYYSGPNKASVDDFWRMVWHGKCSNHRYADEINGRAKGITLDPRLPLPDSVGGFFPGPATTQKVYQGIEWFSQLAELQ